MAGCFPATVIWIFFFYIYLIHDSQSALIMFCLLIIDWNLIDITYMIYNTCTEKNLSNYESYVFYSEYPYVYLYYRKNLINYL